MIIFNKININCFNKFNYYLFFLLCFVFFNLFPLILNGQYESSISKPRLSLTDDQLIIEYDILGSNDKEKYNVKIEILDENGEKIPATKLSGDVGHNVKGGNNKKIIWNLSEDNVSLRSNINIQVIADKIKGTIDISGVS